LVTFYFLLKLKEYLTRCLYSFFSKGFIYVTKEEGLLKVLRSVRTLISFSCVAKN